MGKLKNAFKSISQLIGGKEEHNNADEVIIENNLNINGAFAGASVKAMALYVDQTGKLQGGIATLTDGTSITITVKVHEVK